MDDCSPQFFAGIRRQFLKIPPDDLKRLDLFHLRAFVVETLSICEAQAEQLAGADPELNPIFTATLQLRLEGFSGPTA